MFETQGVLTKKILREIKQPFALPKIIYGLIAFLTIGIIIAAIQNDLFTALLYFAIVIGLLFFCVFGIKTIQKRNIEIFLSRNIESTGVVEHEYYAEFLDDGVNTVNKTTNGTGKISYDVIEKIEETESLIVLFTRQKQFIPVFKNCLKSKDDFKAFLKSKPTKIKW